MGATRDLVQEKRTGTSGVVVVNKEAAEEQECAGCCGEVLV